MGISMAGNGQNNGHSENVFALFVAKIEDAIPDLARVTVKRKNGRDGYRLLEHIDVIPEEIDGTPVDAEELAEAAWAIAEGSAEQNGGTYFCFYGYTQAKNSKRYVQSFRLPAFVGEGEGSEGGAATADEATRMVAQMNQVASDLHARYTSALDKSLELVDRMIEMGKEQAESQRQNGEQMVKLFEMSHKSQQAQYEHEENMAHGERISSFFSKFADQLAPMFSTLIEQWASGALNSDAPPGSSTLAHEWRKIFESMSAEKLEKARAAFSEDEWILMERAAEAKSDDEFSDIVRKLVDDYWSTNHEEARKRVGVLLQCIGQQNAIKLLAILKKSGIPIEM